MTSASSYAEASSYLVVNTLWLSSDMKTVVAAAGISRWPWHALGIALGLTIAALLRARTRQVVASLGESFLSASARAQRSAGALRNVSWCGRELEGLQLMRFVVTPRPHVTHA